MRIVQVLLSPRIGGAETLAASLASEWGSVGVESMTVFLDPDDSTRGRLKRYRDLRARLRVLRPDAVVAHSALPAVYARLAVRRTPVFSVLHSAGDDFETASLRYAERVLRMRTSGVVAVADGQASSYRKRFGLGVPVRVIPNGIAPSFSPNEKVSEWTILMETARVTAQKEPLLWLEAVASVTERRTDVTAEWWGPLPSGGSAQDLEEEARSRGLGGVFRGASSDVPGTLRRASIFVHAAEREAHSIGILEAAASGVPIVCSDTVRDGLPEWLQVHAFTAGSSESLRDSILHVLNRLPEHRRSARDQSARVAREFSACVCANAYLAFMEEVVR